jgi:hypothetical protein
LEAKIGVQLPDPQLIRLSIRCTHTALTVYDHSIIRIS